MFNDVIIFIPNWCYVVYIIQKIKYHIFFNFVRWHILYIIDLECYWVIVHFYVRWPHVPILAGLSRFLEDCPASRRFLKMSHLLENICISYFKYTLKKYYQLFIIVVEYALSLPGTNVATERVFPSINKIWTTEKTQLNNKTLKYNLTNSCEKFHDILINDPNLLQSIHSDQKYDCERKSWFFYQYFYSYQ